MLDCPYDNYTFFERHEREQYMKENNLDDCEEDDPEDWEDEIYERIN